MARSERYTVSQVKEALKSTRGTITHAADKLECDPDTVAKYVKRYPSLRAVIRSFRTRRVDTAELQLDKAIAEGARWAVMFTLSTQGKKRGYTQKTEQEVTNKGVAPVIQVVYEDGRNPDKPAPANNARATRPPE